MATTESFNDCRRQRELAAYRIVQRFDRPIDRWATRPSWLWLVEPFTNEQTLIRTVVDVVWINDHVGLPGRVSSERSSPPPLGLSSETLVGGRTHRFAVSSLLTGTSGRSGGPRSRIGRPFQPPGRRQAQESTDPSSSSSRPSWPVPPVLFSVGVPSDHDSYVKALHDSAMATVTGVEFASRCLRRGARNRPCRVLRRDHRDHRRCSRCPLHPGEGRTVARDRTMVGDRHRLDKRSPRRGLSASAPLPPS